MKRLFLLLVFAAAAWAQPENVIGVWFTNPAGVACNAGQGALYATTGALLTCQSGVFALAGVATFVPYTGASGPVNLGSNGLTTTGAIIGSELTMCTGGGCSLTVAPGALTTSPGFVLLSSGGGSISATVDRFSFQATGLAR